MCFISDPVGVCVCVWGMLEGVSPLEEAKSDQYKPSADLKTESLPTAL